MNPLRLNRPSFGERFTFIGRALALGEKAALRSTLYEVEDRTTGYARSLKVWQKTGTSVDDDLRQLWRHEMRQVERVMSYAGARDVIVDILEFLEDEEYFGVVLEHLGQPLSIKLPRVSRQHWLRNLDALRPRTLFWKNARRLVTALGIVHAQGLVHGKLNADAVMTLGADEPDFQLGGFEWSLWLRGDTTDKAHASISAQGATMRAEIYSFAEDWRSLGNLVAECLGVVVKSSGDVESTAQIETPVNLSVSERVLLKRLIAPARLDLLDADSIARAIDDIIAGISRSISGRVGTFIIMVSGSTALGDAVYTASGGEVPIDEYRQQLDWMRADLDGGVTLLFPRKFDPTTSRIKLVSDTMVYYLKAFRDEGSAVWDIAVCSRFEPRGDEFKTHEHDEHVLVQPVMVVRHKKAAQELRARLGPDVLDWSAFATRHDNNALSRHDFVHNALVLIQIIEAIVKALEIYPIRVIETQNRNGLRYATICAESGSTRDIIAKQLGLTETATALRRLFEEEHNDADAKWRITQSTSLGSTRSNDIAASFVEIIDEQGSHAYQFGIEDELPHDCSLFLRIEQDTGTERVIRRRLSNIKALGTRVDLTEMLDDPWRVRRSSHDILDENDDAFADLDKPKQDALRGAWSILPSFFVVGPPGVGKTKLVTEIVRRRFATDHSTRMLLSAQGHDALDNLQDMVKETLKAHEMNDIIVVRTITPDKRKASDEDVQRATLDYLERLSGSFLAKNAPHGIRERINALRDAASQLEGDKNTVSREERAGLQALSNLVLDAANIVISTANSPNIEDLVNEREQFDWVIIEEAAKATGPELIGPLMLSGRRLLIGDHRQLPPFDADRLVNILSDHSLVKQALEVADRYIGSLLQDGELDQIHEIAREPLILKETTNLALRLLEPFRTFVEDDNRRSLVNKRHRQISTTLTEQWRMDSSIAEIVSEAFYDKKLKTAQEAMERETKIPPFVQLGPLPVSPVVIVDFKHVNMTGQKRSAEHGQPRWHNPSEVGAVIDVLRHIRAREGARTPTLAVLSPYKSQVDKLQSRITSLLDSKLAHLGGFSTIREGHSFVGTVDSFQGSEADIVIVSLVRNNPRTGGLALGFLRDRRRMNVLLSRAKSQLILVGSLSFLQEAVRGVNPDADIHDLAFLTKMIEVINRLTNQTRQDGTPLCKIISPETLKRHK